MITPFAPPSGTATSAVIACDLFLSATIEFSVSRPMPPKRSCECAADELRPSGEVAG